MNLQRIGLKSEFLLKRNFFISKFLTKNSFTVPVCKRIRITFPLYESESLLRSKSIIIMVEFLEQFAGVRAIIKKANLIVGSGLWVRGQVDLSDFSLSKFFLFFNEYFLSHPLLRFSSKLPFLRAVNYNYVKLVISDIEYFFDSTTRRILPHSKYYWLEFDFFFENHFELIGNTPILFYTQFFFSHSIFEWRNH